MIRQTAKALAFTVGTALLGTAAQATDLSALTAAERADFALKFAPTYSRTQMC